MDAQVIQQSGDYRRGVVLGLTMAEIMLLLIFCLLIAMTAFLRAEHQKMQRREEQFRQEQADFRRAQGDFHRQRAESGSREVQKPSDEETPGLRELRESAPPSSNPGAVTEYWRELVEGRDMLAQAKGDGLTAKQLKETAAELGKLKAQGINPDKALHDAKTVGQIPSEQLPGVLQRGLSQGSNKPGHQWPPIITLSEAEGNYFKSGSAELSPKFRNDLNGPILSRILQLAKIYDVDIIEVVGHTDEQPVGAHQSNLDRDLLSVLTSSTNIASIVAGDNAGLGLSRAVSVVSVLRRQQSLAPYRILPLSGGQLIDTNETLATSGLRVDILQRRRIEIRLRKSTPHDASVSAITTRSPDTTSKPLSPKPAPPQVPKQQRPPAPNSWWNNIFPTR